MKFYRSIRQIIARAQQTKRIRDGVVLCDECDNPASKSISQKMSWTGCAACMLGETDAIAPDDVIYVSDELSAKAQGRGA